MKVQVRYIVKLADGTKQPGRKAWLHGLTDDDVIISNIYINEDTATDLSDDDYIKLISLLKRADISDRVAISSIIYNVNGVRLQQLLADDIKPGDTIYIAKPSYPAIKRCTIKELNINYLQSTCNEFYNTHTDFESEQRIESYVDSTSSYSMEDDGIIPNTYNNSAAFRTYKEAYLYMVDISNIRSKYVYWTNIVLDNQERMLEEKVEVLKETFDLNKFVLDSNQFDVHFTDSNEVLLQSFVHSRYFAEVFKTMYYFLYQEYINVQSHVGPNTIINGKLYVNGVKGDKFIVMISSDLTEKEDYVFKLIASIFNTTYTANYMAD